MARHYIGEVGRQDVCDRDLVGIAASSSESSDVLAGDVGGKCSLCSDNIVCSTARAFLAAPISDDPNWSSSPALAEPQPGTLASTRHSSLIRLIFASVVKSFLAIRSMTSLPRAASRR